MEPRTKSVLVWTGILALCFLGIPLHLNGGDKASTLDDPQLKQLFQNFTQHFNKSYDAGQISQRLPHFKKSLEKIAWLNSEFVHAPLQSNGGERQHGGGAWRSGMAKSAGAALYGLTPFADLSPEEFQSTYLDKTLLQRIQERRANGGRDNLIARKKRSTTEALPEKVDWRTRGNVVTPVKHQKSCGACWAFSTVETVESMHAIQGAPLKSLSVQQVIDCSTDHGCSGGDTCTAIRWMSSRKLATEAEYPLTLKDGTCKFESAPSGVQVNSNYTCDSFLGREDKILEVVANHGPVAVAVDATNWQFYMGGVIQWNCDKKVNHAVQIVGYDKSADPPHYILRNSWGPAFGDNGYLYVAIGSNLCGVAVEVTYLSVH